MLPSNYSFERLPVPSGIACDSVVQELMLFYLSVGTL